MLTGGGTGSTGPGRAGGRLPDPFGRRFDLAVADMGVAHGRAHVAMAGQAGRDGQGHARHRAAVDERARQGGLL